MQTQEFLSRLDLDMRVMEFYQRYEELLVKWQAHINLVAQATLKDFWVRHIQDSLQLWPLLCQFQRQLSPCPIADLGSGAGFPGLVLAMAAQYGTPDQASQFKQMSFFLIESDQRKAEFLRHVSRETNLENVTILSQRMEKIIDQKFSIIVSRACASVSNLLSMACEIADLDAKWLLLKGENVKQELTEAQKKWNMNIISQPSSVGSGSVICLQNILKKI